MPALPRLSEMENGELWERLAKVAIGLQDGDPVNWPHYAEEARRIVVENEQLRETMNRAYGCLTRLDTLGPDVTETAVESARMLLAGAIVENSR